MPFDLVAFSGGANDKVAVLKLVVLSHRSVCSMTGGFPMHRVLGRTPSFVLLTLATLALSALAGGGAHATVGTCDTAGPVEIEASGGDPGPTAYASLGAAFAAVNAGTHTGVIDVEVCASTSEGADPAVLQQQRRRLRQLHVAVLSGPWRTASTDHGAHGHRPRRHRAQRRRQRDDRRRQPEQRRDQPQPDDQQHGGRPRRPSPPSSAWRSSTAGHERRTAITVKNCVINGSATGRNISTATSSTGLRDHDLRHPRRRRRLDCRRRPPPPRHRHR